MQEEFSHGRAASRPAALRVTDDARDGDYPPLFQRTRAVSWDGDGALQELSAVNQPAIRSGRVQRARKPRGLVAYKTWTYQRWTEGRGGLFGTKLFM